MSLARRGLLFNRHTLSIPVLDSLYSCMQCLRRGPAVFMACSMSPCSARGPAPCLAAHVLRSCVMGCVCCPQHEKIIRGLAMGLALISYGIEEAADTLIEQMAREQDPILRYGAMYVLGMAYR